MASMRHFRLLSTPVFSLVRLWGVMLVGGLGLVPVGLGSAQTTTDRAHFDVIQLPASSPNVPLNAPLSVSGFTGGSYSLSALSNRDRTNQPCLGYGDSKPDHILEIREDLPNLTLQVNSGGQDTTLVIRGPEGFWCLDDGEAGNPDAQFSQKPIKKGTYHVWVGTMVPNQKLNYRLILKP